MPYTASISLDLDHAAILPNGETWFLAGELDVQYGWNKSFDWDTGEPSGPTDIELASSVIPLTLLDIEGDREIRMTVRWDDPIVQSVFDKHGDYIADCCVEDYEQQGAW